MASSAITSWQIERENVEAVTDFIFLGSKISADGDCSNEIKRHLLLGRNAMTNILTYARYMTNTRQQWHPTPALLPGKSHGWRSLVDCSLWGC